MTDSAQADYFRRREQAQRALADRANNPEIARIHLHMASEYAARAAGAGDTVAVGTA